MRVKVAHVTTVGESLDVLLRNQLASLCDAGYEVAGVSGPTTVVDRLASVGVRHLAVSFVRSSALTPFADGRVFAELVALFRRERFTIVHTHTAKADLYAAVAARVAGVPIVVTTLHGFLFHELTPPLRRRLYATLAGIGMRCCDVVLSQNPEDIETAQRDRIGGASRMELLGNGIDVARFDPALVRSDDRAARRHELGIANGAPVIGYVGRLVAEKGVLELFAAIPRLRAKYPGLRVLIVGPVDDAKRDAIGPAMARDRGIAEACIFTGYRSDLPALYSVMDVCVLASHREGFPRTPMEASAMGVPVVATNIRGCRTAVDDGVTGLLVPVRDAVALEGAIAKLLSDPALRARMAEAGRRTAIARFDERSVFAKVRSTYERLLAARGLPCP